jgi:hypothetical protein
MCLPACVYMLPMECLLPISLGVCHGWADVLCIHYLLCLRFLPLQLPLCDFGFLLVGVSYCYHYRWLGACSATT